VHRKTSGNVLFILQFLSSICEEEFLFFSSELKQWQWNTEMIESKKIADNAIELMLRKILQLPRHAQCALKLMACLGHYCEEFILSSMSGQSEIGDFECTDIFASLKIAAMEGLVDQMGSNYKFGHDQIQLAAYSLIPENERGNWHLWIGCRVWENKSASPDKALFIVVSQLNKGASRMTDTLQMIQLAGLNLQAAEKSISLGAFVPAEFYLKKGIGLLGQKPWADHYDLYLKLYSSCAEVELCIGNFKEMDVMLDKVFSNATCLDDKIDVYFTLVSALHSQGKMNQSLEVGLAVLSQLGESFPTYSDLKSIIVVEFVKTKQLIKEKTDDDFLTMNALADSHKIAAMRMMLLLAHHSFVTSREIFFLIILRMVQTTINHGICDESAFALASLGSMMGNTFGDYDGAHRFGQISLRLLERTNSKNAISGVHTVVFIFIHPWIAHYRTCLKPLKIAYNEGYRSGNTITAVIAATNIYTISLLCGEELGVMDTMLRKYFQRMVEQKQELYWKYCIPFWQAVAYLMGEPNDPGQLSEEAMDEGQLLKEALENNRVRAAVLIYHIRSWLAYIFGNYEKAAKMTEEKQSITLLPNPHYLTCNYLFIDGLVSFEMVRKTGETKWKTIAQNSLEEIEKHALNPPINSEHKLFLLQAESAYIAGDIEIAQRKYDDAIRSADKNGFVQDQALANERAGHFYSNRSNASLASRYYGQAHSIYLKWGAKRKADHIIQSHR